MRTGLRKLGGHAAATNATADGYSQFGRTVPLLCGDGRARRCASDAGRAALPTTQRGCELMRVRKLSEHAALC